MPSYIELDKQSSFPASSNSGKVILGINNNNQLQLTNNSGQSVAAAGLPYQVYTALLTQNGGDNPIEVGFDANPGFSFTVGVTYYISASDGGMDLTNIGAPNNNIGTYFVATGTTANNLGTGAVVYNTGAPTVTVLENTIGNVWWTYDGGGQYFLHSSGLFTENKTLITYTNNNNQDGTGGIIVVSMIYVDNNRIKLETAYDLNFYDGAMTNMPIEIRVYN